MNLTKICLRSLLGLTALAGAVALFPRTAAGSDWMFRPSYFSHQLTAEQAQRYPVPHSLSAYRPAVVSPYPGFAINGVSRVNQVVIPSGASFDSTILHSNSVRVQQ